VTAIVRDVFEDDLDREYAQLVLVQDGSTCMAHCQTSHRDFTALRSLIGATVRLSGVADKFTTPDRGCLGRILFHHEEDGDIEVVRTPAENFLSLPPINQILDLEPSKIYSLGPHTATGTVVAVWSNTELLIRTNTGRFMRIRIMNEPAPTRGETISAAGFPDTCLFHLNLINAVWKPATNSVAFPAKAPKRVKIEDLMSTGAGRNRYSADYYGETIVVRGRLISMPDSVENGDPLLIDVCGHVVPAFVTAKLLSRLQHNSTLDITGTLILDTDNWHPAAPSNAIRRLFIVTHSADDVRVIGTPPWWTPVRLATIFGILLTTLTILLVKVRTDRMKTALKVGERTRIAIELHDSVAQSLTGVAMELEAVRRVVDEGKMEILRHLDIGVRALKSCRDDLRNCLWDLRNPTIEDGNLNHAIAYTLKPHIEPQGVNVRIRINIERNVLPDDIVHILLRIIRELTVNAVRHGYATVISIAGVLDKSGLKFSVSDNGCGFDHDRIPGVLQGHFGLQGIRERLKRLKGSISIRRNIKAGMHISFQIPLETLQTWGKG